jgi:hypothetical protein
MSCANEFLLYKHANKKMEVSVSRALTRNTTSYVSSVRAQSKEHYGTLYFAIKEDALSAVRRS